MYETGADSIYTYYVNRDGLLLLHSSLDCPVRCEGVQPQPTWPMCNSVSAGYGLGLPRVLRLRAEGQRGTWIGRLPIVRGCPTRGHRETPSWRPSSTNRRA